jgi:hypothetical protein
MDYFKSSNASFGVSSSINRAAPREPGKSVAALLNSYEARLFTATASPPREVKAKMSFGGGFYLPKRDSTSQSQDSEHSARFKSRGEPAQLDEEPRMQGQGIIDSLEQELLRLKQESYFIKEQQTSKPLRESLLHLDPPSHRHIESKRPEDMSLADLEMMRSLHAAKLVELETEYFLQKKEPWRQSHTEGKDLRSHDYEETRVVERPPKEPVISKYEAKYERYLNERLKQKRGGEVEGNVVGEVKEQERNELKLLVKYMFNKLDNDRSGLVDRLELMRELHSNPELAELFSLKSLVTDEGYVDKFSQMYTKVAGSQDSVSLPQLYDFFRLDDSRLVKPALKVQKPSNVVKLSPRKETESSQRQETVCLLLPKHINLLESLFNYADEHQDFVVSRRKIYDTYFQDERVVKLLAIDAVKLSGVQTLSLETMFEFMLQDGDGMDELITWRQLLNYFYTKPELIESHKGTTDPRLEDYDLPEEYMQIVKELFDSMPRHTRDKVSTYKFLTTIRRDPQVKGFLSMRARETHKLSDIPGESLNELLARIEEEADAMITWHEVLGYFSRRGQPELEPVLPQANREPRVELRSPKKPIKEAFVQTMEEVSSRSLTQRSTTRKKPQVEHNRSFDHYDYLGSERISYRDLGARSVSPRGSKHNITIPKPFDFDRREVSKKKSIRQKKVEEMVQQKELELLSHINFKYKAKAIPAEVTIPRYEGIKASQEARRYEVKRTSKEKTKSSEKPFNFYLRDLSKDKPKAPSPRKYEFKANPIPWEVSVPLYEKLMTEDKAARDERIARAAQEALRKSKLPPRMEMHENSKPQQAVQQSQSQAQSFKAKDPPDFAKLQKKFQDTLEAKKEARKPTETKPFNFREIVRKVKPERQPSPRKAASKSTANLVKPAEPVVQAKTTQKMKDMVKKKQQEKAKADAKAQAEQKADEDRRQRLEAMKPRVQGSQVVVDKTQALKEQRDSIVRAAREKFKEQEVEYARKKEEMMARVSSRPLLVEQATSQTSKHNSRLKTLLKVKQSLVKEGVNPNTYFNEEERDLIEDAEYLVKVGRLNF